MTKTYGVSIPVFALMYIEVDANTIDSAWEAATQIVNDIGFNSSTIDEWEMVKHFVKGNVRYVSLENAEFEEVNEENEPTRYSVTVPIAASAYVEVDADDEESAWNESLEIVDLDTDIQDWEILRTVMQGNVLYASNSNYEVDLVSDDESECDEESDD